MFELFHRFVVAPESSLVGGVSIIKEAAPNPDGRYVILPDGAHPGTVLQGLLANAFIEACNRSYGTNLIPLSDQEILASAGISVPEGNVTFFDIRPFIITKYSGGTGESDDPYQIATAEDLMLLGESPEDYDKNFILTADIDLDPNLPGRKVFDKAVIAADVNDMNAWLYGLESPFTGSFDGNGHIISNLMIEGESYLGLFGQLEFGGEVKNLGTVAVNITGLGGYIGGLVGHNRNGGDVTNCYSTGAVTGEYTVGGLVGSNSGTITRSYSTSTISGVNDVGGLVGSNIHLHWFSFEAHGTINNCYSTGGITGETVIGGLVGLNTGSISNCYSNCSTSGRETVGGFVGANDVHPPEVNFGYGPIYPEGVILNCYSTGFVSAISGSGGLVGDNSHGKAINSFWNIEVSYQISSDSGTGLTHPK